MPSNAEIFSLCVTKVDETAISKSLDSLPQPRKQFKNSRSEKQFPSLAKTTGKSTFFSILPSEIAKSGLKRLAAFFPLVAEVKELSVKTNNRFSEQLTFMSSRRHKINAYFDEKNPLTLF